MKQHLRHRSVSVRVFLVFAITITAIFLANVPLAAQTAPVFYVNMPFDSGEYWKVIEGPLPTYVVPLGRGSGLDFMMSSYYLGPAHPTPSCLPCYVEPCIMHDGYVESLNVEYHGDFPPGYLASTPGLYQERVDFIAREYSIVPVDVPVIPPAPPECRLERVPVGGPRPVQSLSFNIFVPGLAIDSLEVSQAIQENMAPEEMDLWLRSNPSAPLMRGDLPVPLVEGKDGLLRVYLKEVTEPTRATVKVWVRSTAADVDDWDHYSQSVDLQPGCTPREARLHLQSSGHRCTSVDFFWSGQEFIAGSYVLWIGLEQEEPWPVNGVKVGQSTGPGLDGPGSSWMTDNRIVWDRTFPPILVNETDALVVHPVAVCHDPWDLGNSCGKVEDISSMSQLLMKVVPTADVRFSWGGDRVIVVRAFHPGDTWWDTVITQLEQRAAQLPDRAGERHILFGIAHPQAPGNIGGMGVLLGTSAVSRSSVLRFPQNVETSDGVMAHETGHVFGLEHTETDQPFTGATGPPGCYNFADTISPEERATDGYFFWPYAALGNWLYAGDPSAPSLEVGLDFTRQEVIGSSSGDPNDPNLSFEMMGYCTPRWVTSWSYRGMYAGLNKTISVGASAMGRFYEVSGTVSATGIVLDPIFTVETSGSVEQGTGSHQMVVRGEDGNVLYTRSFTPRVATTDSATGGRRTLPYFSELLPEQPGAASIAIVDSTGSQVSAVSLGGTAPAVEISFPLGSELLQGVQNIRWNVTDPDSSSHSYWVQYSPDGGTTWSTVATSYPETVLPVDFDSLPGATGTGLIRVYASDGTNTGEATAGPLTVPKKLPRATVVYPQDGTVLHVGEFLTLQGAGFDADSGFLSGAALTWSSPSLGGPLGIGEQSNFGILSENLIGNHTLLLTAVDVDGNHVTATVGITVEAAPVPGTANLPPVAVDTALITDQDTSLQIHLGASDPENDALTYTVGVPAHGTLRGTAPDLTYQPAAGYFGLDSFTFSVTDIVGAVSNTATVSITVNRVFVDSAAPAINCGATDGVWHAANVAISCTAVDNESGLADPADASFTLQTTLAAGEENSNAATVSRNICDHSNNCVSAGPIAGNMVDLRQPGLDVSATSNGQLYPPGTWTNADVVVSFACTDAGSGVNNVTGAQSVSAEVLDAGVNGTCRDNVGNEAITTFSGIRIDKTAPNPPSVAIKPLPNADGWHRSVPVAVTFSSNGDAGAAQSGVATCTAPGSVTAETALATVSGTCTDLAGNQSAAGSATVRVDMTTPTVTVTGVRDGGSYPLEAVPNAACATNDALSGVATPAALAVSGGPGAGTYRASCSGAVDRAGNVATPVTVTYQVVGNAIAFSVRTASARLYEGGTGRVALWADAVVSVPGPADVLVVDFDGLRLFTLPFSAFRRGQLSDLYYYAENGFLVTIDLRRHRLFAFTPRMAMSGVDNSDGVIVGLAVGNAVGQENIVMRALLQEHLLVYVRRGLWEVPPRID